MNYDFVEIENKWRKHWAENKTFHVKEDDSLPKYYVLDMFPYPSGAGLHVGHPLGYIVSDIYSDIKSTKDLMYFTQWGMILLGCRQSNTRFKRDNIPQKPLSRIFQGTESNWKNGFCFDWSRGENFFSGILQVDSMDF